MSPYLDRPTRSEAEARDDYNTNLRRVPVEALLDRVRLALERLEKVQWEYVDAPHAARGFAMHAADMLMVARRRLALERADATPLV